VQPVVQAVGTVVGRHGGEAAAVVVVEPDRVDDAVEQRAGGEKLT
jgi:hypothetical protein